MRSSVGGLEGVRAGRRARAAVLLLVLALLTLTGCAGLGAGTAVTTGGGELSTTSAPGAVPDRPMYPGPGAVSGDIGVHDPSMVKRPRGGYLLAGTGPGIPLTTSPDRIVFNAAGAAFPVGTPWADPFTGGRPDLWAPDLSLHDGTYYLYYAASTFGSNHSAIFLATSATGEAGSWSDRGLVVESKAGDDVNAIDPNLVVDATNHWWLAYGSFWSGVKLIALDPTTGKRADDATIGLAARPGHELEAPYLVRHGGYYYLYLAFDRCCQGADSTYRIMVGRSTGPAGPFADQEGHSLLDGGGTQLLASHGGVHGPGHPAVFEDVDATVLVYHYYTDAGDARLGINLIGYDPAGWPFVY